VLRSTVPPGLRTAQGCSSRIGAVTVSMCNEPWNPASAGAGSIWTAKLRRARGFARGSGTQHCKSWMAEPRMRGLVSSCCFQGSLAEHPRKNLESECGDCTIARSKIEIGPVNKIDRRPRAFRADSDTTRIACCHRGHQYHSGLGSPFLWEKRV
jgi:hypothetical protein